MVGGAPLGLAAAAGMLAAVNPCGFALLPAYLSFLIIGDDTPSRGKSIARALTATAAMTAGFAAVFVGVVGPGAEQRLWRRPRRPAPHAQPWREHW